MTEFVSVPPEPWLVWSNPRDEWWKSLSQGRSQGHTSDIHQAGRYTEDEAKEIARKVGDGTTEKAMPLSEALKKAGIVSPPSDELAQLRAKVEELTSEQASKQPWLANKQLNEQVADMTEWVKRVEAERDEARTKIAVAVEALEDSSSLLTTILHERRTPADIEAQIIENRNALTVLLMEISDTEDDYVETCIACAEPLQAGELYLPDESGGIIHYDCLGPERECYTLDGEPLKDGDPIPQGYIWSDDPLSAEPAPSDTKGG